MNFLTFQSSIACRVGAYNILKGESLWALKSDGTGLYSLYAADEAEPFALVSAALVNKLAGREIAQ